MNMIMDFFTGVGGYVLPFLVVLTILVFVHEMGHYLVARWNGVRVEVFSIGFGPEIKGWNDSTGTRWKFCWIPFGGYVKFFGDSDGASRPDDETLQELSEAERTVSFHHKRLGQRAAVVAAGPIANFIYAILVLTAMYMVFGQRVTPAEIGRVVDRGAGQSAGFQEGDVVLAIDGKSIHRFEQLEQAVFLNPETLLAFRIERRAQELTISATPRLVAKADRQGIMHKFGDLGLWPANPAIIGKVYEDSPAAEAGARPGDRIIAIDGKAVDNFERLQDIVAVSKGRRLAITVLRDDREVRLHMAARRDVATAAEGSGATKERWLIGILRAQREPVRLSPGNAVVQAVRTCYDMLVQTLAYVGQMISGRRGTEDLGGPIRIAHASGQAAQVGVEQLIMLSVLLSLNLGMINLFPIPILDGGHLLFYGFEAILRRPLTERTQDFAFRIGLALVLTLTVFATWNDLVNLRVVEFIAGLFS
ncbi:MAG: RIP metalloprotease RseP [Alphaproteobacteria bacterium]|jgi:regulator of sigma E protease|nr:RIP metalloprotease RseP [Rhodospirillaceae bacterium]MDP6023413.1 RIP metalloprotease RseP [Alphaproteobacteria bacterium]MDP7229238.1 RIP metalloprotease RseP [Alphaproteobacteria bacterium]|tara:strand:+ start:887 stop:2314 length:1428 start_codon:yes stop_codon:yes gene_type:complete